MDNLNYKELENLTDEERKAALKILEEYSKKGKSETYSKLILEDYNEIPVDIVTFLHDPKYLGKALTSEEGKYTVFPYWEEVLKNIFPNPLKPANYNTAIFTGAIGLGKSTIAVIAGCYELYRMLCLKNPYTYYGIQEVDKISCAVINITKDAAHGVAWTKMQNLLKASDWFLSHGTLTRSDPPEWRPPESVELIYGSKPSHIIGRALFWCLDGDTEILTTDGVYKISELENKFIEVYSVNNNNVIISDKCTVKMSGEFTDEYQIELENGTIIKCTPNHRFMLKDGSYKEAQYLTEEDELMEIIL